MKLVSAAQMKEIERRSDAMGVTYYDLMLAAGVGAADYIDRCVDVRGRNCLLFCGRGNNGGDGIVAARRLRQLGAAVAVVLTDGPPASAEGQSMYTAALGEAIPIGEWKGQEDNARELAQRADLIVDAVYGTGFSGLLSKKHKEIFKLINEATCAVFALDLPSGAQSDSACADPDGVQADFTITFHARKPAHLAYPAVERCGKIEVLDIGIPEGAEELFQPTHLVTTQAQVQALLPQRLANSHKGSYGRLLNLSGCAAYMGAPALSTLAAMRSGVGIVTLASTGEVCRTVLPLAPESVLLPLPPNPTGGVAQTALPLLLERAAASNTVLAGCGLSLTTDTIALIKGLICECPVPLVLDADGINAIEGCIDILAEAKSEVLLTPHIGELARLAGVSQNEAELARGEIAADLACKYNVTLLVKGPVTTIHTPDGRTHYNTTGNPGLAKAGSGDVLAGLVAGLAAQGLTVSEAAVAGAWLHGAAADLAAEGFSMPAMLARDVIGCIGGVFARMGLDRL